MKNVWKIVIENIDFLNYCEKNHIEPLSLLLVDVNSREKILTKKAFIGKYGELL